MGMLNLWPIFLCAALYALLLYRFLQNRVGKPQKRMATVVDKYYTVEDSVSNARVPRLKALYVVVFDVKNRILKFDVPVWFYGTIEKGEMGILIYKGTRFINFETN